MVFVAQLAKPHIVNLVHAGSIPVEHANFLVPAAIADCLLVPRPPSLLPGDPLRVLKLDISGVPESWITLKHAVGHFASGSVAYTLGEPISTLRGGRNDCGLRSTAAVHPILAVNGVSAAGKLLAATPRLTRHNHKLFRRDRYTCGYCGGLLGENKLERASSVPCARLRAT